jgi:hypothetical protein
VRPRGSSAPTAILVPPRRAPERARPPTRHRRPQTCGADLQPSRSRFFFLRSSANIRSFLIASGRAVDVVDLEPWLRLFFGLDLLADVRAKKLPMKPPGGNPGGGTPPDVPPTV